MEYVVIILLCLTALVVLPILFFIMAATTTILFLWLVTCWFVGLPIKITRTRMVDGKEIEETFRRWRTRTK